MYLTIEIAQLSKSTFNNQSKQIHISLSQKKRNMSQL